MNEGSPAGPQDGGQTTPPTGQMGALAHGFNLKAPATLKGDWGTGQSTGRDTLSVTKVRFLTVSHKITQIVPITTSRTP